MFFVEYRKNNITYTASLSWENLEALIDEVGAPAVTILKTPA